MADATPSTIDVFADIWCPFAHVSLRRFVERRRLAGRDQPLLRVHAWPLELVNGVPLEVDTVAEEIVDLQRQVAADLFARFETSRFPSTTIPILAAAEVAYEQDLAVGESFSLDVRDALFEHGRDVGEPAVLEEIAERHGIELPDAAVANSLVEAELAEGRRRGVTGSPHFYVGHESFFCPGLEIRRRGEHLEIAVAAELEAFLARAFG